MSHSELLEVGRRKIEDVLVDMRDARMGLTGRGNGLVIRERNGSESNVIRMGPEEALRIGLRAMIKHIEENPIKDAGCWERLKEALE